MPQIIDNKETKLAPLLQGTLENGVALDACVGYLNLRGWDHLAATVDELPGVDGRPPARVLVGMAARESQLIRDKYKVRGPDEDDRITAGDVPRLKADVLRGFKAQLLFGTP